MRFWIEHSASFHLTYTIAIGYFAYPKTTPETRWTGTDLADQPARQGEGQRNPGQKPKLPQGSVLSPILSIIFINNLRGQVEDATLVSAYADDLAIDPSGI